MSIRFSQLNPDGTETHIRTLSSEAIGKCPYVIFVAEHYRDDGSCRCDDPNHHEMKEWGYTWHPDRNQWVD
jgi:hypothetical protein